MTSRHLAESGFVLLLAVAVALEARGTLARRRTARTPTLDRPLRLGEALASAMTTRSGKVLVLGWWWWLGWHFLAR